MDSPLIICDFFFFETGHNVAERRFMEAVNAKEYEYEAGNIPTEWEGNTMYKVSMVSGWH